MRTLPHEASRLLRGAHHGFNEEYATSPNAQRTYKKNWEEGERRKKARARARRGLLFSTAGG